MAHASNFFDWFYVLVRECPRATGSFRQFALDEMIPSRKTQVFVIYDGRDGRKVGLRGNLRLGCTTNCTTTVVMYALIVHLRAWFMTTPFRHSLFSGSAYG